MYNFRYHLVTIVSIFAALALGLLLGVALTGSDLVRDASTNLAQSLTDEFDKLNQENRELTTQLETESQFSEELRVNWQAERLVGRTIAILTRQASPDDELVVALSDLIARSGGTPVIIRIAPESGIDIESEQSLEKLQKIVPSIEGEDYSQTVARQLVAEWSFTCAESEPVLSTVFDDNYHLTNYLVASRQLTITVDYQLLINSGKQTGTYAALVIAPQLPAYTLAQSQGLPYGVNGIIDLATFTPSTGAKAQLDSFGLDVAQQFDAAGEAGELPYLRLVPRVNGPSNEIETGSDQAEAPQSSQAANYYAVLVQSEEFSDLMNAVWQERKIPCEFSPLSSMGRYSVIALLTGGEKGSYGQNRNGTVAFPSAPSDRRGNVAFDNIVTVIASTQPLSSEVETEAEEQ